MASTPPLTPKEQQKLRSELIQVSWQARLGGVVTVVLGAVLVLFADSTAFSIGALRPIGFGLLGFGWVVLIYAIVKRTRYASRRRAELLATHVESPSDG